MTGQKYKINPLVLVGTPTLEPRPLSWEWMDAMSSLQFPLGASVSKLRIPGKDVAEARNELAQTALDIGADYMLMIGDDNLPPPNLFGLLHRHRKDLVTGVYWQKSHPTHPYLWDGLLKGFYEDWKYGEFFPIDFGGCDALLASTEVFRTIPYPWFSREWVFEPEQQVNPMYTEDFYFYAKARQYGFQLFADTAAQLGHQDRATGVIFGLQTGMPQLDARASNPSEDPHILVADIGCGFDTPWFGAHAEVVRFDANPKTNPDYRCDIRALPVQDNSFDVVHAQHVLEHFMWEEAPALLAEWVRILKKDGELRVSVPNLAYAAREILRADENPEYSAGLYPLWQLYGRQNGSFGEVHRNGFTRHGLARLLSTCSELDHISVKITGELNENLEATAKKVYSRVAPMAIGPTLREAIVTEPLPASPSGSASSAADGVSAHTPSAPPISGGLIEAVAANRAEQAKWTTEGVIV